MSAQMQVEKQKSRRVTHRRKSGNWPERGHQPTSGLDVRDVPDISGLAFRCFSGKVDYQAMTAVINGSKEDDGLEWANSVEDIERTYRHLVNCNPETDMLFAEVEGNVVGYSRVWWSQEAKGTRLYQHFAHLLPEWRGKGIRRALMHRNERRLNEIAGQHPEGGPRFFEAWSSDTEEHWQGLLQAEGYEAVRYAFSMVRPNLDGIPALPLPEGVEVRPVGPEHVSLIWAAAKEAFRDHWGYSEDEWSLEHLREWQESPTYTPELWQVAWDGDQVAGMVQNFINEAENQEYGRKRGYTEGISVRRPWRRQGLARALIARSFRVLKDRGMTEAALGVDADNPNGALQLYESMGFRVVKRHITFRKPLAWDGA
jgi:mycothiol synthase